MTARTANWDAIAASAPMNKDAALARDGRGVSFEIPEKHKENAFDLCPPLKKYEDVEANNLTGERMHRLVVLGLCADKSTKGPASWACRCDCGRYARFTTKGLRSLRLRGEAMCSECRYVELVKAGKIDLARQAEARAEKSETKAALAERRRNVDGILWPKLLHLRESVAGIGISAEEFRVALAEFVRVYGKDAP